MKCIIAAILLGATALVTNAEHFDGPVVQWTYQIGGSGALGGRSFRKNNGIVSSFDQSSVFATADDGSLHILKPSNLDASIVVEPPTAEGTYAEGRSSVVISERDGVINFAVYAVVLTPVTRSTEEGVQFFVREEIKSRVIAVHEDGSIRWISEVSGYVEGTPVVGVSGTDVYVSHNVRAANGKFEGRVSIIRDTDDDAFIAAEIIPTNRFKPFGPLTTQSTLIDGEERDMVFWGESSGDGTAQERYIYALYPSSTFAANSGMGSASYILKAFGTWSRSLITKPAVSDDLSGLWAGGTGSVVEGWTGDVSPAKSFDKIVPSSSNWSSELELPEWDLSQPLFTSMTVSSDNELVYLTDTAFNMLCIEADTGDIRWFSDGDGDSGYRVEPKLTEIPGETPVVYTIESMTGKVRQHNALTGFINWESDCSDRTDQTGCQDGVEAEFSISASGNFVYFGDIYGTVTAMEVGSFPLPTLAPTASSPITSSPVTSSPVTVSPISPVPESVAPVTTAPFDVVQSPPPTLASVTDADPTPSPVLLVPTSPTSQSEIGSQAENDDSGIDTNQILLYSLIAVSVCAAIAAIAFFGLMFKKKRKADDEAMVLKKKDDSKRKWEDQQRNHKEECRRQEMEILRYLGAVAPVAAANPAPQTPKKNPKVVTAVTPSTVASVEESTDEDRSIADQTSPGSGDDKSVYSFTKSLSTLTSLAAFGSVQNEKTTAEEKKDDDDNASAGGYLPKALASTFEQVGQTLGMSSSDDPRGSRSASPTPSSGISSNLSRPIASSTRRSITAIPYSSDRPWADADDSSSIGSESLFLEDDGWFSAFSNTDDASQPGIIASMQAEPKSEVEGDDAWSSLMHTIIKTEETFVNPTTGPTNAAQQEREKDLPFDEAPFDEG